MTFIPSPTLRTLSLSDAAPDSFLFAVFGKETFLKHSSQGREVFPELGELRDFLSRFSDISLLYLGELDGRSCVGVHFDFAPSLPDGFFPVQSRHVLATFPPDFSAALCRGRILLSWRKNHRFCGKCGSQTAVSSKEPALQCLTCGNLYFPQISPAVIVLVTRGHEVLLAHNRQFTDGMFGLVAGFVEAGECLEDAVRRELREETGVEIKDLKYRKSQSWPFPNSLMFGFRAEYSSGEARADGVELDDVRWFTASALPQIPPPGSIARSLLDEWLLEQENAG